MDSIAAGFGLYAVAVGHLEWGITAVLLAILLPRVAKKLDSPVFFAALDIILSSVIVIEPADTYSTASLIILTGSLWTPKSKK